MSKSNMDVSSAPLNVVLSSDLNSRIKIKIGSLEGKIKRPDYEKLLEDPMLKYSGLCQSEQTSEASDLLVKLEVFDRNKPICLPVSTSYKPFTSRRNWNEWVTLPIRFSDLPKSAQLCITVYDCGGPTKIIPVGGTTIKFFSKNGILRQGMLDLRVWPGQVADGNDTNNQTPGKGPKGNRMYRLNKLQKKHRMGQMSKVDWLDRLAFCEIEAICDKDKRESDFLYLNVEFPIAEYGGVQYGITFHDSSIGNDIFEDTKALGEFKWLPDHEIVLDNLVENKHHTLSRCTRTGPSDIDLKPTASLRDQLNAIVNYPPTKQLSAEEQDLIWKYRYYLSSNKKALAKFLKCVKWAIAGEERQALELLEKWAPMDVDDALELLGPSFSHQTVRSYAVARLRQAPDEDLYLYLLQLVQALKYENVDHIKEYGIDDVSILESSTQSEIMDVSVLESESKVGPNVTGISSTTLPPVQTQVSEAGESHVPCVKKSIGASKCVVDKPDLASFLIERACENTTLANYFFWYLSIECEDQDVGVKQEKHIRDLYRSVMSRFLMCLKSGTPEWQKRRTVLIKQQQFIEKIVDVVKTVAKESANRQKKMDRLQNLLSDESSPKPSFSKFDPLPFPLDPEVLITGIVAKESILFKSSQMPCRLSFTTTRDETYLAIFKHGDDLRQDQLILQIITLMDKLLRKENLDLKLSPYRVLATSTTNGFVQFIQSTPVAEVLANEGSIQNFFKKHNPSSKDTLGFPESVMDTYVKSCAGYCVITYILGIGDRHLDNLLLTEDGRLFHIDFGYILGRDPKPMPPPMKLSKEMVDAMGGVQSEYYQEFKKLCYTAFLHLRRHANLILNLFSLMVGASVPDIALEPDKTVKKVLDKFRLELDDEAAVKHMQELIDISVSAMMPALVEQMHKFTQMLRK